MHEADFSAVVGQVVEVIREFRPDVVITFGPDGGSGHPDHITIGAATTEACRQSGDPDRFPEHQRHGLDAFEPRRLYHAHFPPDDVLLLEHLATWLTSRTDHFAGTLEFAHSLLLMAEEAGTMGFIRDSCQVRWFPPGCFVVEQGEPGRELFLILSGIARVVQESADGTSTTLRTLGAGEFFGELGVASQHVRSAHVIARVPGVCRVAAEHGVDMGRSLDVCPEGAAHDRSAGSLRPCTADRPVHLAATLGLALEPVAQRASGDVEQPGRRDLVVHRALEQCATSVIALSGLAPPSVGRRCCRGRAVADDQRDRMGRDQRAALKSPGPSGPSSLRPQQAASATVAPALCPPASATGSAGYSSWRRACRIPRSSPSTR